MLPLSNALRLGATYAFVLEGKLLKLLYRSPSPQVHSFTKPEGLDAFTLEEPVTKSGATLTYGPYKNIPQSTSEEFVGDKQKRITVHYECDFPVVEISKLTRAAEISHWGANLNIEDNFLVHNGGPK